MNNLLRRRMLVFYKKIKCFPMLNMLKNLEIIEDISVTWQEIYISDKNSFITKSKELY